LRRITSGLRELSEPVIACGYRNSASALPNASDAYVVCASTPLGISEPGFGVWLGSDAPALSKIAPNPPSFDGM
jgi:hypothetical protein